MTRLGLESHIVDRGTYDRTVTRCAERRIALPRFSQLIDPDGVPPGVIEALKSTNPDAPDARNLFRVHWFNDRSRRGRVRVPDHLVLPPALTGVAAPIAVLLGDRFPMISAHKVLAAYACLAPRIVTGQFDPVAHKAIWPSTGNYCRGGVAISRILGCRGVAVLPEGMSAERFHWLERWVQEPEDIIRTPGSESNVKEIYDACAVLSRDPSNVVFNQFCEFGNYLSHYACTGRASEVVFDVLRRERPSLKLCAFVSATGSAGTLGAGDYLKSRYASRTVAVEALECPTLLYNGFGEHNIQGIGDKHVPLIHNVMNTDFVVGVSDRSTDALGLLFASAEGRDYLGSRRGVPGDVLDGFAAVGLSGLCNIVAAVKVAKYLDLGPDDQIVTVATDGSAMYDTEHEKTRAREFPRGFDTLGAAECYAQHILGAATDHVLELSERDRHRIFNLGYYTWVEQQGVPLADFERRRRQDFWEDLHRLIPAWDALIDEFNARTGAADGAA
jgi:cysteine synthase